MPHQNTVFHQLLQYIPWQRFDALAKEHGHSQTARTFKPRHHLVSLLNGALSGVQGLRATVTTVSLDAARLYHAGGAGVKRTTLADANRYRDAAAFSGLLEEMIALAHRKLRRDLREALYLFDATSIKLNSLSADWARAQRQSFGAKAHVVYDAGAGIPVYSLVTAATVNDIKVAKKLTIEPKATYAFDLGYHDFQWFADLHDAECRFVTRFKKNTAFTLTETRALPKGAVALADRIGRLSTRMARSRKNPFDHPIRQIEVQTDTGKTLLLMTNDLTSPADEIAAIYKRRWEIELFFRWIKQGLNITRFIGTSENAVRTQVAVNMIAFLLLRLAQSTQTAIKRPLEFLRAVRATLMRRRPLNALNQPQPTHSDPRQVELDLPETRCET